MNITPAIPVTQLNSKNFILEMPSQKSRRKIQKPHTSNNYIKKPFIIEIYNKIKQHKLKTTQKSKQNPQYTLVLFHTKGSYEDDWEPMTPARNGKPSNFKWNGQRHHRDDNLMLLHGKNTVIVTREKNTKPFKYWGKVNNIECAEVAEVEKGIPKRYILKKNNFNNFNNISPGTILEKYEGEGWIASALKRLGLRRVKGNHLGGIQLCENI